MRDNYISKELQKKKLITELLKGIPLSVNDLCNRLNCSRRNIYYYLADFKKDNITLSQTRMNQKSYYWISTESNSRIVSLDYEELTPEHLREFTILETLQAHPMTKNDLIKQFDLNLPNQVSETKIIIDIKKSKFYELLHALIVRGDIVEEIKKENRCILLYLSGDTTDIKLYLSKAELLHMYKELSNQMYIDPCSEQFLSIYDKVCTLLGITEKRNPFITKDTLYATQTHIQSPSTLNVQLAKSINRFIYPKIRIQEYLLGLSNSPQHPMFVDLDIGITIQKLHELTSIPLYIIRQDFCIMFKWLTHLNNLIYKKINHQEPRTAFPSSITEYTLPFNIMIDDESLEFTYLNRFHKISYLYNQLWNPTARSNPQAQNWYQLLQRGNLDNLPFYRFDEYDTDHYQLLLSSEEATLLQSFSPSKTVLYYKYQEIRKHYRIKPQTKGK